MWEEKWAESLKCKNAGESLANLLKKRAFLFSFTVQLSRGLFIALIHSSPICNLISPPKSTLHIYEHMEGRGYGCSSDLFPPYLPSQGTFTECSMECEHDYGDGVSDSYFWSVSSFNKTEGPGPRLSKLTSINYKLWTIVYGLTDLILMKLLPGNWGGE